jgi:hypothetical protein
MTRFALALLLGLLSPCAWADEATCEPGEPVRAENRDGSVITVQTECASPALRRYVATLACEAGRVCDRLELTQEVVYNTMGGAHLVDIDQDGLHEVEVRGMCGAGPNCEGEVYRIDPATMKWQHFFSGGYYELQVIDGWLVEAGRSSCCSWEFHLWRLDAPHQLPLNYDNMDLMVQVGASGDADTVDGVVCTFLRQSGDNSRVVAPPSRALERICEHYGEPYELTSPDTTPGAP